MMTFIWHCEQGHVQEIENVPGNRKRISAKAEYYKTGCDWRGCGAGVRFYAQYSDEMSVERVALALFLSNRDVLEFVTRVTDTGADWHARVFAVDEDGCWRNPGPDCDAARVRRWEAFFVAWCRNEMGAKMDALWRASAVVATMAGHGEVWV